MQKNWKLGPKPEVLWWVPVLNQKLNKTPAILHWEMEMVLRPKWRYDYQVIRYRMLKHVAYWQHMCKHAIPIPTPFPHTGGRFKPLKWGGAMVKNRWPMGDDHWMYPLRMGFWFQAFLKSSLVRPMVLEVAGPTAWKTAWWIFRYYDTMTNEVHLNVDC